MEEKLKTTLQKIKQLSEQNEEFASEMRKMFGKTSPAQVVLGDGKIDEIYEYCLEKVLTKHANDFYEDFPLPEIKDQLVDDFIKMERFRREDDFGDCCLHIYEQIENIINNLCNNEILQKIVNKMWAYPEYVDYNDKQNSIPFKKRYENGFCIAKLLFGGYSEKTNFALYLEKTNKKLSENSARDKIRVILYFVVFSASLTIQDSINYKEFLDNLFDIYICRNTVHRGNKNEDSYTKRLDEILPMKSFYYFKFVGVLVQFVELLKHGMGRLQSLYEYSNNLPERKLPVEKLVKCEITHKLPGGCFVKGSEIGSKELKGKLLEKVKNKNEGDFLTLIVKDNEITDVYFDKKEA